MLSLVSYIYSKLFRENNDEKSLEAELDEELYTLECDSSEAELDCEDETNNKVSSNTCFERTGKVTFLAENYGLIDGSLYFENNVISQLKLNQKVRYLACQGVDNKIQVVRLLFQLESDWTENDKAQQKEEELNSVAVDEKHFNVRDYVIVAKVSKKEGRWVLFQDNDCLKFNLDEVKIGFIPMQGDWLEVCCKVQWDDSLPCGSQAKEIISINTIRSLRSMITKADVVAWDGTTGVIGSDIFFDKHASMDGFVEVGTSVIVDAIESDQGACSWRALSVVAEKQKLNNINPSKEMKDNITLDKEHNLNITHNLNFGNVSIEGPKASILLEIKNEGDVNHKILKWKTDVYRHDSQIFISPMLFKPVTLQPKQSFVFTVSCKPKYLGFSKETITIIFEGFEINRNVTLNIINSSIGPSENNVKSSYRQNTARPDLKKFVQNSGRKYVPGEKLKRTPNFVPVKLHEYKVPKSLWDVYINSGGDANLMHDTQNLINNLERTVPCLKNNLSISNYKERWHALLFFEEIQQTIAFRNYDLPNAFLRPVDEYLTIEFKGLSEKRPSLIAGDKAITKDMWNSGQSDYEGIIHQIKGDTVYLKFNRAFHETYQGSDVSLEFFFARGSIRRRHQAIDLAVQYLGPNILFPTSVMLHSEPRNINVKDWFNPMLNKMQKEAIQHILNGVTRPMPYVIFGPPGTGKTVTVVEAIHQIFHLCPDSRILIATPSNSSANLITQRLTQSDLLSSGSLIRIIAAYMADSETIPEEIRPYCATLNIATERTSPCTQNVNDFGINLNCGSSHVGRHRITIGTCVALGVLAQMELKRGHFTHIIVDEAGQATEPDIMIPFIFLDKSSGQMVLSGDPMQLGPVVMSKVASVLGFGESYLSRLLNRFPYQKDIDNFKHNSGYDSRFITQLTDNYRSINEVLDLPSKLFYDKTLVPQLKACSEIEETLNSISDIIPSPEIKRGGIFFCGIRGENFRAEDSPSWYNIQEAGMVLLLICKLYKRGITPEQIGVITPYIAQVRHLRNLLDSSGIEKPKIGSVEDFQGQERKIIILSTVRSAEGLLENDAKFSLGFVNSPKRVNVALTRAQVAVFIFGNPHLLYCDNLWRNVINYCYNNKNYYGCDLPSHFRA